MSRFVFVEFFGGMPYSFDVLGQFNADPRVGKDQHVQQLVHFLLLLMGVHVERGGRVVQRTVVVAEKHVGISFVHGEGARAFGGQLPRLDVFGGIVPLQPTDRTDQTVFAVGNLGRGTVCVAMVYRPCFLTNIHIFNSSYKCSFVHPRLLLLKLPVDVFFPVFFVNFNPRRHHITRFGTRVCVGLEQRTELFVDIPVLHVLMNVDGDIYTTRFTTHRSHVRVTCLARSIRAPDTATQE